MNTLIKIAGLIGAFVGIVVLFGLAISWPLSLLWNMCLVPAVNGLNEVGIFQMWGIYALATIIFKGVEITKK